MMSKHPLAHVVDPYLSFHLTNTIPTTTAGERQRDNLINPAQTLIRQNLT